MREHTIMLKLIQMALLTLAIFAPGLYAANAQQPPAQLQPLIAAMEQRLEIANDVARSKWHSGKPVQDSERERLVIQNAESRAGEFKLAADDVHEFMTAQMEANKMVQYARIEQWRETGHSPEKPESSLTDGIRGRLDTLLPVLMQRYSAFQPYRSDAKCPGWVQSEIQRQASDPFIVTALQRAAGDLCRTTASQ
ncbi:chorismate mutase [Pseudomonas petrae]|uniref:chorismate mutase n=1 Tax=Pseudomonas petrae TaxID=2912190 RepID=A0ABS9I6H5_9PSED|nr:chorismate mutase [Pseudomonas petrae]MCF7534169.1 chorismate mutase [Pseudomonas petrae]MCF7537982.1 chorismate mutase [Pseudomonas petrae]MCF7543375.1 chorismate mutase [Pseudomonas petrae]MCF7555328.1 chorismate mutase [Pseudomonas petrae]